MDALHGGGEVAEQLDQDDAQAVYVARLVVMHAPARANLGRHVQERAHTFTGDAKHMDGE